jgi:hypothetical protein
MCGFLGFPLAFREIRGRLKGLAKSWAKRVKMALIG